MLKLCEQNGQPDYALDTVFPEKPTWPSNTSAAQLQYNDVGSKGATAQPSAYHNPYLMAEWDTLFYGDDSRPLSRGKARSGGLWSGPGQSIGGRGHEYQMVYRVGLHANSGF